MLMTVSWQLRNQSQLRCDPSTQPQCGILLWALVRPTDSGQVWVAALRSVSESYKLWNQRLVETLLVFLGWGLWPNMVYITAFNLGLSDQTIFSHIVVLPRLCDQDAGSDKKLYTCTICRPPFLGWSIRGRLCRSSASTSPSPPLHPWTSCVVFHFSSINAKWKALTEVILRKEKKTKQNWGVGVKLDTTETHSVVLLYLWETSGKQHTARGKQSKVNTRELNESQMSVCVGGLWGMGPVLVSYGAGVSWVGSLGTLQHKRP